jgi:hypothetical protein
VFGNRVLRRIFRLKRGKIIGGWRKFQMQSSLIYMSLSDIRMIKSRRMRWTGYV